MSYNSYHSYGESGFSLGAAFAVVVGLSLGSAITTVYIKEPAEHARILNTAVAASGFHLKEGTSLDEFERNKANAILQVGSCVVPVEIDFVQSGSKNATTIDRVVAPNRPVVNTQQNMIVHTPQDFSAAESYQTCF